MNLSQIVITAVLTTFIVLSLLAVGAYSLWPKTAIAATNVAAHAGGWSGGDGDFKEHCSHIGNNDHIEIANAVVTAALDLTDAQQASLEPINEALGRWGVVAQQTCEQADISSLDGKLGTIEVALGHGAEAVKELRPMIVEFHNGLSEEQQAKLHSYMQRHHHKKRGFKGHRGWGH